MNQCEICGSRHWVGRHHKYHQTKYARKLYTEIIDHPKNVQWACADCHAGHRSPKLIHWTEEQFCWALGIKAISKIAKMKNI